MLRPDDTFPVYPDGEGEGKPVLHFKAQSAAYWIDYEAQRNALKDAQPGDFHAQYARLAEDGLVRMENMDAEKPLLEQLTLNDVIKVVALKIVGAMLSDSDKKKSLSLPQS